jgi:hypothetical protein
MGRVRVSNNRGINCLVCRLSLVKEDVVAGQAQSGSSVEPEDVEGMELYADFIYRYATARRSRLIAG